MIIYSKSARRDRDGSQKRRKLKMPDPTKKETDDP
jgi:hypothetical protein